MALLITFQSLWQILQTSGFNVELSRVTYISIFVSDIAETLCYLLVGSSVQGASQNIELVSRTPQELYEIVCLIGYVLLIFQTLTNNVAINHTIFGKVKHLPDACFMNNCF